METPLKPYRNEIVLSKGYSTFWLKPFHPLGANKNKAIYSEVLFSQEDLRFPQG